MTVVARVSRKTQDLVRNAAEDLLREKIDGVGRVTREELWTFEVEGDGANDVRRLLDETTLVVNPNVHRYTLEEGSEPPDSGSRLVVRVHDRVDSRGSSVLRSIRERRRIASVTSVALSTRWTVDLAADSARAEEIGEQIAGILANPHAQDVNVEVLSA